MSFAYSVDYAKIYVSLSIYSVGGHITEPHSSGDIASYAVHSVTIWWTKPTKIVAMFNAFVKKCNKIIIYNCSHAGIVKRSLSTIAPGIWITVTFIHQTLSYLQMTPPGVPNDRK